MLSRYSRLLVVSAFMLSGASAQAAVINVLHENTSLYTEVGYSTYPEIYSQSYSGLAPDNLALRTGAFLISEPDIYGEDMVVGTGGLDSTGRREATVYSHVIAGSSDSGFNFDVTNDTSILGSLYGEHNQAALDSVFAYSHATLNLIFEVQGGNSSFTSEFLEFESGYGVSADFFLMDLTTGTVLEDIFSESPFGISYNLQENHQYRLAMSIDNYNVHESSSTIYLSFSDNMVLSVAEPSTLSLFILSALAFSSAFRRKSI